MSKTILAAAMLAAMTASLALGTGSADARKYPTGCDPDLPPSMCDIFKKKKKGTKPSKQASAGGGLTTGASSGTQRAGKPAGLGRTILHPDMKDLRLPPKRPK
jgi:hypothetical protein